MPNVKVKHRETLLDVAVLQTGSVYGMFEMALLNNISITKELASGEELMPGTVISKETADELRSRNARPAKAIKPDDPLKEGIGYWKVFVDFIVQ